jgi:hypothetical protein
MSSLGEASNTSAAGGAEGIAAGASTSDTVPYRQYR